jgi:hypothetical protein
MVKCLHFSVRYMAKAFGEAINNVFVDTVFTTGLDPHYPIIIYAYKHINETKRPLMRLLVDYHCERYGLDDCVSMDDSVTRDIPLPFWRIMMERYAGIKNLVVGEDILAQGRYHLHAKGEDREACEACVRLTEGSDMGSDSEDESEAETEFDSLYGDRQF